MAEWNQHLPEVTEAAPNLTHDAETPSLMVHFVFFGIFAVFSKFSKTAYLCWSGENFSFKSSVMWISVHAL